MKELVIQVMETALYSVIMMFTVGIIWSLINSLSSF